MKQQQAAAATTNTATATKTSTAAKKTTTTKETTKTIPATEESSRDRTEYYGRRLIGELEKREGSGSLYISSIYYLSPCIECTNSSLVDGWVVGG